MSNKARLTALASQLTQNPKSAEPEPEPQTVREVPPALEVLSLIHISEPTRPY